ncbi:MAG: hypothetical protein JWO08_1648 [Verrucomicrobiaceae bacterium]|nr:hypothetical protein [Verrucomicrobiaceae bacterium]
MAGVNIHPGLCGLKSLPVRCGLGTELCHVGPVPDEGRVIKDADVHTLAAEPLYN